MRTLWGRNYVQVLLGGRYYTYYCPGAAPGSCIRVPGNLASPYPQVLTVSHVGRGYIGRVKRAQLVDA